MSAPFDSPLGSLYQEVILDHNKNPRNFGEMENPAAHTHAYNPLCGDDYNLYLDTDGKGAISKISFSGTGCAISKSSASMLTSRVKGKTLIESQQTLDKFLAFLTNETIKDGSGKELGNLSIFEGVRKFPARIKCATMIWHALATLIKQLENGGNQNE